MKAPRRFLALVGLAVLIITGCSLHKADRGVLYQFSTLSALMEGVYDGGQDYGDLLRHGDFGLGTFAALDGEMVALDGRFYQVKADGQAYPVPETARTPFAMVTFFRAGKTVRLDKPLSLRQLEDYLDGLLPSPNLPYAVRIEGAFSYIKTRSVPRQTKPYPRLAEAVRGQTVFEFHKVQGTIVGFRIPGYLNGVNMAGYHFHFITGDRRAGGHLLDCQMEQAEISLSQITRFYLRLPKTGDFLRTDLTGKGHKEAEQAEK